MKPEEFTSFKEEMPEKTKWIIVTNNIDAQNAHDEMSHVWLTSIWHEDTNNKMLMYDDNNFPIINLTHWKYA